VVEEGKSAMPDDGGSTAATPVTLPGASQFDFASRISGRTYRIFVSRPLAPPPACGYPVVFVTDANLSFPIAATQGGAMAFAGKGLLVVGVGYPNDDNPAAPWMLRLRDLSPPTPLSRIKRTPGQPPPAAETYGGSQLFFRFLTEELRPAIHRLHPIDAQRQTLYGHSLGGLFALEALFKHPGTFQTYVASSPSIWWNGRALLRREAGFARQVAAGRIAPRVLITMGALEQTPEEKPPPGMTMTMTQYRKLLRDSRMVDNARELAARLARLEGARPYLVRYVEFADEGHMSVVPASLGRALTFAMEDS
jgi:hypothetical protein